MCWVNEHTDNSLLLCAYDDGVVRVWRDVLDPEDELTAETAVGPVHEKCSATGHALASAFIALPDIAESTSGSRGSGMLASWYPESGVLAVAGNSSSIRLWDVSREQCVRAFHTQLDTCVSAMSTVVADGSGRANADDRNSWAGNHGRGAGFGSGLSGGDGMRCSTLVFTGFADGTIAMFDERCSSMGGRVMCAREHGSWVVSTQMVCKSAGTDLISASVSGTVKFWDVRKLRSYDTVEVLRSPLTALASHQCAPIMACGSQAQLIKIMSTSGDQLGVIRYHEGFMGQRIGPVLALAFHPFQLLLAAAASDKIVSVYGVADLQ